jgi:hypothetical protein
MFTSSNELPQVESKEKIRNLRFAWMLNDMDRLSRTKKREWVSNLLVKCAGILINAGTGLKKRAERLSLANSHTVPSFQGR